VFIVTTCPDCKSFLNNIENKCNCGYIKVKEYITLDQYFAQSPTLDLILISSAKDLLIKVNSLLEELGCDSVTMTSGYRDPTHNSAIGGAPNSKHTKAQAIDIADNDRVIGQKLLMRMDLLRARGCAIEDLNYCVLKNGNKWIHIQSVLPSSGRSVFIPYSGPIVLK